MKQSVCSLALLILLFFEPGYKILVGATPDLDINPAPSVLGWEIYDPYEKVEPSEPEDVPLRYEVIPTPVAFELSYTDSFYPREGYPADAEQNDIFPTPAMHVMPESSFHHVIYRRQADDDNTEFSGQGADCPELSSPANGNRNDDESCGDYNSNGCTATFTCNDGYTLNGQSQLTCREANGQSQWNGNQPNCVSNRCPQLTAIENGNREDSCETHNGNGCTATFSCNSGYTILGQRILTCTETNGQYDWNADQPTCRIIACGQLDAPANGRADFTCPANFENCQVRFSCNSGYELISQDVLRCQENSTWSGNSPTCNPVDCGNPGVDGGNFTGSTTFGESVTFQCHENYTLTGNAQATCQANGQWDQLPNCTYNCGDPPTVANATFLFTCTTENCYANVTCSNGLILEGDDPICVRDVGWAYEPYCRESEENGTGGVDISITLPATTDDTTFQKVIVGALVSYYSRKMKDIIADFISFIQIVIRSIRFFGLNNNSGGNNNGRRKRQLEASGDYVQVNYSVVLSTSVPSFGEFAKAQADMVRNEQLVILGNPVDVLRTSLFGFTYFRNDTADLERLREISCEIFEYSINGCPADTTCQLDIDGDTTVCEPIGTNDDFAWQLGLAVGLPLFLLACAVLGCCIYYIILARRRRRKRKRPLQREYESSESATMSGFSPTMIPTRFNTIGRGGPLYGSYFLEAWDSPEAEESIAETPRTQRRSSVPYVVTVGYQDQEEFPSNFSWDFMYPHVAEDFSLPRPRV
ncbi:uncharacterized protein LOC123561493 isoform X2 [Mercenaria mercenaria]|uniref:uncharacterized protein LOC123561493 isoform X2 n=1 Tax=Mercenaria mercenaria TaxID=6596 RepID=UPI00234F4588|nr:uncharacterized protein LOC123561493 isoform X2 [Mercenaria mercenaria]